MKFVQKIAITFLKIQLQLTAAISPQKAAQKALKRFCTPRRSAKQQKANTTIAQAERISSRVNGLIVRGYRWNHPSAKKILIAHGFESAARNFEGYVLPLMNLEYEIVAFDAPGHGESEGNEIHLPLYVAFLQQIAAEYGPFDAYLGHSFGGLAITHLLETIETSPNTRIILIAPATETTTAVNQFFKQLALNGKVRTAFDRLATAKNGVPPEHYSIRRAVRHIPSPILWLHDSGDEVTPFSDAESVMNDQHPNVHFIVSRGLGHSAIYRNQQTIDHVTQFLN